MKYFKNIKNLENLKEQYRTLLKTSHPDNGGDTAIMQEINAEFAVVFKIWKDKTIKESKEDITETAAGVTRRFYTEYGWEGSRYNSDLSLKEIAKIVRMYVKEKYPTYKFGVRTEYYSMGQSLNVDLKESPVEIYKTYEELTDDDKRKLMHKFCFNHLWVLDNYTPEEKKSEFERIWNEHGNFYKCLNETTQSVIDDVDSFVKSYNYEDIDSMQDYYDVSFSFLSCCRNNGMNIKVVPRAPKIENKTQRKGASENKKTDNRKHLHRR